jgi:hypothetical protein
LLKLASERAAWVQLNQGCKPLLPRATSHIDQFSIVECQDVSLPVSTRCPVLGVSSSPIADQDGISFSTLKIPPLGVCVRLSSLRSENCNYEPAVYLPSIRITPKGTLTRTTGSETVAIELPLEHVAGWKLRHPGRYLTNEEIAIELTQGVAIAAADRFVVLSHDPLKEKEIHSARFLPERLPVMDERECDYEDNGIRA